MGRPAVGTSGISRLDLAKMAVEDFIRQWRKMRAEHTRVLGRSTPDKVRFVMNLGQYTNPTDQFVLLSTSKQHPDSASASAIRFSENQQQPHQPTGIAEQAYQQQRIDAFQRELKGLNVLPGPENPNSTTPTTTTTATTTTGNSSDTINYATGLNAALSAGLQLLSRYRLQSSQTENFGMGRLPNCAVVTANGSPATAALQPASLILVTDGACLRLPPKQGGGALQLQFGSQPLRELYREPFRWDQRIFVVAVGGRDGVTSAQYLHPQLRALTEVTGGYHWMVRGSTSLSTSTDMLIKSISPPMPRELPLPEPLYLKIAPSGTPATTLSMELSFINGGPICCFQAFEAEENGKPATIYRAMLLYVSSSAMNPAPTATDPTTSYAIACQPLWCIPEAFFPSKKLDTLPPRSAQPLLFFSRYPSILGSKSFEPMQLVRQLLRFDQMTTANRKLAGQPVKYLHRDVYVCEWINPEGGKPIQLSLGTVRSEYYPVFVQGAGRPTLSDDSETYMNIGILHIPSNCSTLGVQAGSSRLASLTLLPPEPHILLPLLIRAAEIEYRVLKRIETQVVGSNFSAGGSTAGLIQKQAVSNPTVPIDEHWRSEFRAYLFRLPPYYQNSVKRALKPLLPSTVHSLLHTDDSEPMAIQCFSKVCHQKIRNGEQIARDNNERQERQERQEQNIGSRGQVSEMASREDKPIVIRYGQYDPRSSTDSYLAALRSMPPPWKVGSIHRAGTKNEDPVDCTSSSPKSVLETLGDLPSDCLLAYYECRRRWIFGGPGLAIRGLHVEGVRNDGSNSQRCGPKPGEGEECLLTLAGVGASTLNRTSTTKMGEYKERLLFSRSPIVGYGSNDASGVAATTAIDGSPRWSVDDDAMPTTFFDPKTGEFVDSAQARVRSKLQVNFGNPYKEKRADSLIPEKYLSQAPPRMQGGFGGSAIGVSRSMSQSSPNDDSFDSVEEGEAIFVRKSPSRLSPKRDEPEDSPPLQTPHSKRARSSSDEDLSKSVPQQSKEQDSPKATKPPPPAQKQPLTPLPSQSSPSISSQPQRKAPPMPPKRPPPPKPPQGAAPPPPPKPSPQQQAHALVQIPGSKASSVPPPPPPPFAQSKSANAPVSKPPKPTNPNPPPSRAPQPNPPRNRSNSVTSTTSNEQQQATKATANPNTIPVRSTTSTPSSSSFQTNSTNQQQQQPQNEEQQQQQLLPQVQQQTVLDHELENQDLKPAVDLPAGWISVWSKSKKRWYFFDTKTSKSLWNWPPP